MPLGDIRARLHHVMVLFEILPRLKQENLLKNLHENNLYDNQDMANFSNNYSIWRNNYRLFLEIDPFFCQLIQSLTTDCLLDCAHFYINCSVSWTGWGYENLDLRTISEQYHMSIYNYIY